MFLSAATFPRGRFLLDPPLVYVNHSCDPNCGLLISREKEILQLHALRPLREGEELSIDYDSFEYEIHFMPEQCLCGSQNCRGRVRGFKHLPVALADQLADGGAGWCWVLAQGWY